jgi:hypothetical protein
MFFNYRSFLKALDLSLIRQPFRLRRWAYVALFIVLYALFLALVMVGRGLDEVLGRGFRRRAVSKLVFIIAPPRSGTTFLQKLLSLDDERFVHHKMYQTILPAVSLQRLVLGLAWLDRRLGSPVGRLVNRCERKWFGGWDDMHRMRLNQPEEDQALFLYAFAGEAVFLLFPFIDQLWEVGFPDALPDADRRRLMAYYRSCLQRHLHANGADRTLLVKATNSCGAVESLIREFPDARFITITRHPRESIASHVSVFVPAWQAHSPEIRADGPEARSYAGLAVEWYRHLFRFSDQVAPQQYFRIDYRDLVGDPLGVVETLYRHFGWSISPSFRARLEDAVRRHRQYRSRHHYSLEEFGLSEAWIEERLGDVIAAYGLNERPCTSAPLIEQSA